MLLERIYDADIIDNGFVPLKQTVRNLEPAAWIYSDGDTLKRPKAAVFSLPDGQLARVRLNDDNSLAFSEARYVKDPSPALTVVPEKGANMQPLSLVQNNLGAVLDPQLSDWLRKASGHPLTAEGETRPSPQ